VGKREIKGKYSEIIGRCDEITDIAVISLSHALEKKTTLQSVHLDFGW